MKNTNKLFDVVHYIVARADGKGFGATKLNKVLWIADMISWRERHITVSGIDTYRRMDFGPVPTQVMPAISALKKCGAIVEHESPTNVGIRKQLSNVSAPDLSNLDASDVDYLNMAINYVSRFSAKGISNQTHDVYWEEVPPNQEMSVSAASLVTQQIDDEDVSWALQELA